MTDYDRFKALMADFGVPLHETKITNTVGVKDSISLEIHADDKYDTDKVEGYGGFVSAFVFDKNGKFVTVGVWE